MITVLLLASLSTEACKKACIPLHDAKVLACKTVASKEAASCLKDAERERRDCEASCSKPPRKKRSRPAKAKA